ncbi:MAG: hypothetical protein IID30_01885 [Planctomycetes bacterium]|nr:hypothetical protein [Planctomycetota bacterium]
MQSVIWVAPELPSIAFGVSGEVDFHEMREVIVIMDAGAAATTGKPATAGEINMLRKRHA